MIAAVSGKTIRIYKMFLWWGGTVTVTLKDGASTRNLTGALAGEARTRFILDGLDQRPWFTLTQGNAFIINLSGATQVSGSVSYTQV